MKKIIKNNKVVLVPLDDVSRHSSLKKYLADKAPETITAIGNLDLLHNKTLAVFSSSKCPGGVILKTYDLMKKICAGESQFAGMTVISGFHSPMEKECLNILLKGQQPVIICPARSLESMKIKPEYREPIENSRLLILSAFTEKEKRISAKKASYRNCFVAALADTILIPYAAPKSKTEQLYRELLSWKKSLYTINSESDGLVPLSVCE